jgi:hypothetical protein
LIWGPRADATGLIPGVAAGRDGPGPPLEAEPLERLPGTRVWSPLPGGDTAYEMIEFFHAHKGQILRLAASPKKLAKLPTKRKVVVVLPKSISIPSRGAKINRITVDDVDTFAKVKRIKVAAALPSTVSEDQFKRGVQAIIGEPGVYKDWGGERSDLYSTRLRLNGKRRAVAFACKGPGTKGKLVPGKMGENGDQALRLLQEDADIFVVLVLARDRLQCDRVAAEPDDREVDDDWETVVVRRHRRGRFTSSVPRLPK